MSRDSARLVLRPVLTMGKWQPLGGKDIEMCPWCQRFGLRDWAHICGAGARNNWAMTLGDLLDRVEPRARTRMGKETT